MTEQTDVTTDAVEQPTQPASGETSGVTREEFEELRSSLQGTVDKKVHKVDDTLKDLQDALASAGVGLSDGQVDALNERVNQDTRIAQLVAAQVQEALGEQPGKVAPPADTDLDRIFEYHELPESERVAYAEKYKHNAAEISHQLSLRDKAPPVSPAAAIQPGGSKQPGTKEGDALVPEYTEKMLAAAGNAIVIRRLKEEYRAKGVPVDQVTFGS